MIQPNLIINYYAILVTALVGMVIGFLWFGPLFGKTWAKEVGMAPDFKPDKKAMNRAMLLQIVGLLLISYVLAHSGQVWRPSVWGAGEDIGPGYMWGFMCAFFTWIGFFVPMHFGKVAWENKSWKLFAIHAGHDFILLFVMSTILAYWR